MNSELLGQNISFSTEAGEFQGYLVPSVNGTGPGVILIQEWWGLVGHICNVADRLAGAGFTVFAPDFYKGKSTAEPDEAGSLMMALEVPHASKVIGASVQYLLGRPETLGEKCGVAGFCMGGQLALFAACQEPQIGAAIDFYGIHPNVQPDLANLNCPLLGLFAEHDDYASPATVRTLSEQLDILGKSHEFVTYQGAHHAFFNNDRPAVYSAVAAADAWNRMIVFFSQNLNG